ncbi:MAG: tetratricopeptide repeat protein [Bacteroidales bacterium]|nr:tetratricopeptide repeat protein [Bacteroidales bacterium]
MLQLFRDLQSPVFGEEHPVVAQSYNNIGTNYYKLGDYGKALEYYRKALEIREKALGPDHPSTLKTREKISEIETKMASIEEK